eukprot:1597844-Prorocentrum_lima.AAC.1
MVIGGNSATENQALCDSTSTQNAGIGLPRMMLRMTNGKNETLTTTDMANAFLNTPVTKDKTILVAAPNIFARLGIVEGGTVWKTRSAVYGHTETPRLWQEERDK